MLRVLNGSVRVVLLLSSGLACSDGAGPRTQTDDDDDNTTVNRWSAFHIDSLMNARAAQGVGFLEFLDSGAITAGLYHLEPGATDDQESHGLDEVYYVLNGSAQLEIDGVDHPVVEGNIHYVKAGVSHRFHDIAATLDLLVVFSTTRSPGAGDAGLSFTMDEVTATRNPSQNVWNPFLNVPTMIFGMYMLPSSVGGDNDLTHTWDELNIVVNGSSTFTVDGDDVAIRPGSLVFVERGAPHRFRNLAADIDVLIFWNQ